MKNKAVSLAVLTVTLFLLICGHIAAAEQTVTALTAAISKNGAYVELKCTLSDADLQKLGGKKLSLYSLPVGEERTLTSAAPVSENINPAPSVNLQAAYDGDLTRTYVIAADNDDGGKTVVTNYACITNPDALAPQKASLALPATKKGLNFTMFADAQLLGVGNTVVDIALNEFITENSNGLQYRSADKYCFIDRNKLDLLDGKIKRYSDAGIRVFLRFVLTKRKEGQPEYLYFPEASGAAEYYAINVTERKTADALFAFTAFIVNRYTAEKENGAASSVILGCEVNSNRDKNSAGPMSIYEYTDKYAAALRTVDAAARSVYADARVYVSLGNNLNKSSFGDGADPALDYSVTEFLSRLSSCISEEGDIPWRVEVHPDNIDDDPLFNGKQGSEYTYEADYLTMDNINVITSLLSRPAYLYNGQRRSVVINDVSFKSGSNTAEEQKAQAAAFCLAYFKAEANDQIEAFIYADHCDSTLKGATGLYTKKNGTDNEPDEKKQIYKVFRYIDTESSRIIAEPYLSVFAVSSWGETVSGYNGSAQTKLRILSGTGTASGDGMERIKPVRVTDLSDGAGGFYPSENAKMINAVKDEEGASLYGGENSVYAELYETYACEYRGVSVNFKDGADIGGNEYALVDIKVNAPENVKTTDLLVRFTGVAEDGTKTVYEGAAQISSDAYHRIYFDISEFSSEVGRIERASVWVIPHDGKENGEYTLLINGISVFHKSSGADGGGVLVPALIIAGAIALLIAAAYVVIFIKSKKQYKKQTPDGAEE